MLSQRSGFVGCETASEPRNRTSKDKRPARILVADDEPSIRTIVGYALSHQGWEVTSVEDGSDVDNVMAACQDAEAPFDLAILDLDMPLVGGYEAYQHIQERYPGLPVLFISGWPRETVWRAMADAEAEFVAKPFSIKGLVEKVRGLLREAGSTA